MFLFVVRHLGFLKHIPILPQYFDSLLKLAAFVTRPALLDCLDEIESAVSEWPGIETSMHKYGGVQFDYRGREIGHLHGNGVLDVLCGRSLRERVIAEGKGRQEPVSELFQDEAV